MKVHPQQQADTRRIPAYHRRKDAATDHGIQSARSAPRCTRRTELVPAQNPEAHHRWGKRWLIAQTRGIHTDAGLTGRTETIDEHCHQCQKLSAAAVARSHGRPCQRPLINPEGSGQLYHLASIQNQSKERWQMLQQAYNKTVPINFCKIITITTHASEWLDCFYFASVFCAFTMVVGPRKASGLKTGANSFEWQPV